MTFNEHHIQWDKTTIERLWNYYSRTPPFCDVYFSKLFGDRILRRGNLPLSTPLNVLDFGSGPGFMWDHLERLRAKWQYTAVDFSRDSVGELETKLKGRPNFRGALHITRLPTPMANDIFDLALLIEVVEHLPDDYLSETLQELSRVIKPKGRLLITTPNKEDLGRSTKFCPECGSIFHEWQHVRSWSVISLTDWVERFGFKLVAAKTLNFSASGILAQLASTAIYRLRGRCNPHMVAVFEKP